MLSFLELHRHGYCELKSKNIKANDFWINMRVSKQIEFSFLGE